MTYKIYGERQVIDDLNIKVADVDSANNIIQVLDSMGSLQIRYYFEEEPMDAEAIGEVNVNIQNGEEEE